MGNGKGVRGEAKLPSRVLTVFFACRVSRFKVVAGYPPQLSPIWERDTSDYLRWPSRYNRLT